jgi:hypothetical protein
MQSVPSSSASGSYSSGLGRSDPVARADEVTAELLSLNGLQYVSKDTSLSLVTSRTQKRFDAVQTTVTAGNMLNFRIDAGSQFLNPRTSWIQFTIDIPNAASANDEIMFSHQRSAFNLLNTYRFNHSSGVEVEHIEDYNTWSGERINQSSSFEFLRTVGKEFNYQLEMNALMSYTPPSTSSITTQENLVANGQQILIPLYLISDMFRQNVMLPPWLMSGSLIQFTVEEAWKGFLANSAWDGVFSLSKCQIVLDLYTLTDGTVRALSDLSASAGLDIDFTSVWQVNQFTPSQNTVVAVTKALSQASAVHAKIRDENQLQKTTGQILDSFCSAAPADTINLGSGGYYITLGSLFMPQQPIQTINQLYAITKQCWNMFNERPSSWTTLSMFKNDFTSPHVASLTKPYINVEYDAPNGGDVNPLWEYIIGGNTKIGNIGTTFVPGQLFSYLLERSMILASSCAVSSQRSLQVILNMNLVKESSSTGWRVSIFTEYQKVVSVFLDSCIVRS